MLVVWHPARTTQLVNLVSQTNDIAVYVLLDLQAKTAKLVRKKIQVGYVSRLFGGIIFTYRTENKETIQTKGKIHKQTIKPTGKR